MPAQQGPDELACVELPTRDAELIRAPQRLAAGLRVAAAAYQVASHLRPIVAAGVAGNRHRGVVMGNIREGGVDHGSRTLSVSPERYGQ